MSNSSQNKPIITVPNLVSYFFDGLNELNNKAVCPVPQEVIFYTCHVLDKFSLAESFFEKNDGKVREKILGIKLLEAQMMTREERKRVFQEIGDTALFVCGYFSESVNRKLFDISYYAQLGKTAYHSLNSVVPEHLNVPSFYHLFASSFEPMTILMSKLASQDRFSDQNHLLRSHILHNELSERETLLVGIQPNKSKKVS
jgi:hypothetical protein